MNKIITATAITVSIVMLTITGCYIDKSGLTNTDVDSNVFSETSDNLVNPATPENILNKINSNETFAFIIGSESCSACLDYKDNLRELKDKENVVLDYIDLDKVEDLSEVSNILVNYLNQNLDNGLSTPTTYFIIDGELSGTPIEGSIPKNLVVQEYINGLSK